MEALVERFARAAAEGQMSQIVELDHDIHRKIWELSGNEHLADVLGYLTVLSTVIVALEFESRAQWREVTPASHRKLVEAVASGDLEVAGAMGQAASRGVAPGRALGAEAGEVD